MVGLCGGLEKRQTTLFVIFYADYRLSTTHTWARLDTKFGIAVRPHLCLMIMGRVGLPRALPGESGELACRKTQLLLLQV